MPKCVSVNPPVSQAQQSHPQQSHSPASPRNSHIRQVTTVIDEGSSSNESEDEYVFTLGPNQNKTRVPETSVEVNGVHVNVLIDTGASTDILDEATFSTINKAQQTKLQPDSCKIFSYGANSRLTTLGKFTAIVNGRQTTTFTF